MLYATTVTTEDEIEQIHLLNKLNYRHNVTPEEKDKEGFVSWEYPITLLQQLQNIAPHVIVKEEDNVVGYALVTMREAAPFHKDLQNMFNHLAALTYNGRLLNEYNFYCMGQVCIDKAYRGQGVFNMLYQHHKKLYQHTFDMLITEISPTNPRSQRAHEKVGFKTIYQYRDAMDEWNVVVWNWK